MTIPDLKETVNSMSDVDKPAPKINWQRFRDIRGGIGQSVVRELDTTTMPTRDALWLASHTSALRMILDIASGSSTANSLPHIAKIAEQALSGEPWKPPVFPA